MVFFDKFDESNFEVDSQELDVQAVTVSEIKREYSELGSLRLWPLGEQTARKDGKIISRTYKTLTFANDAIDFDFVDLGYIDPTVGSQYQWRIIHEFTEKERYSSCDPAFGDFKIWEVSDNEYQMEITYDNEITILDDKGNLEEEDDELAIFTWTRPKDIDSGTGIACPSNPTVAAPGFTLPGPWVLISSDPGTPAVGADPGTPASRTCERWSAIEKPFYLVYDAGKSLGAQVSADLIPSAVYISTTPGLTGTYKVPKGTGAESDPYQMEYRYLVIEWLDPGRTDLTTATVIFRGNEAFRIFLPVSRDQDPECPEHFDETPYIAHAPIGTPTRYKPFGEYDFPDNFWNDTVDTTIEGFLGRFNVTPGEA